MDFRFFHFLKIIRRYIYCNNTNRPGFLALEIVYVLKPSGGTDTENASKYLGVSVGL